MSSTSTFKNYIYTLLKVLLNKIIYTCYANNVQYV
jgi:hypothetical protein